MAQPNLQPLEPRTNRTPAALLPYQQAWCADKSPVKTIEKSRRIGLSWAEAADCVIEAAREKGQDCWYIGYTKDMAIEFILDCADWAKHFNHVISEVEAYEELFEDGDERQSIQAFRIKFESGFRIVALSSQPRNLRGKQGRIIIDEAAFHDKLRELLKAAMAMLMWGGQVHIISTHDGDENPFNELINEIRSHKKPYSLHRVTFDDAVQQGLFQRICLRSGKQWTAEAEVEFVASIRAFYGDDAEEELDCVPSRGTGVWLPRALIEARMYKAPVVRWKAPEGMALWSDHLIKAEVKSFCEEELLPLLEKLDPEQPSVLGEDFGRNVDLTVLVPAQIERSLIRRIPFLVELSNAPFKAQEFIFFYICDRLPRFSHAHLDGRGNGQYLSEVAMQRYGEEHVTAVQLTELWYRENTAPLKDAFEADTIRVPADLDVLNDLAAFRKIKGVPRIPDLRTTGKDGQKRHGDAGIAVLMMFAASRMDVYQPYTYKSASAAALHRDRRRGEAEDDDDYRGVRTTAGFNSRPGVI